MQTSDRLRLTCLPYHTKYMDMHKANRHTIVTFELTVGAIAVLTDGPGAIVGGEALGALVEDSSTLALSDAIISETLRALACLVTYFLTIGAGHQKILSNFKELAFIIYCPIHILPNRMLSSAAGISVRLDSRTKAAANFKFMIYCSGLIRCIERCLKYETDNSFRFRSK
jgi:hypothetical protein